MFGELEPVGGGDPIPLKRAELLVGRNEPCDIVLRYNTVSSRHCRLVLFSGYWYVVDNNSTNGVKVNSRKVQDHRLDPDDVLSIGRLSYRMVYNPKKNGNNGVVPPDTLETDVFSRSLLEKAGLVRGRSAGTVASSESESAQKKPQGITQRELEEGLGKVDYSQYSLDDIKYER